MITENFVTGSCNGGGSPELQPGLRLSPVRTYLMKRNDTSDPVGCIKGALKYVQKTRQPVYPRHRLSIRGNYTDKEASPSAQQERKRRATMRDLFERLSRYYRLAEDDERDGGEDHESEQMWGCPSLLREGKLRLDHSSR